MVTDNNNAGTLQRGYSVRSSAAYRTLRGQGISYFEKVDNVKQEERKAALVPEEKYWWAAQGHTTRAVIIAVPV